MPLLPEGVADDRCTPSDCPPSSLLPHTVTEKEPEVKGHRGQHSRIADYTSFINRKCVFSLFTRKYGKLPDWLTKNQLGPAFDSFQGYTPSLVLCVTGTRAFKSGKLIRTCLFIIRTCTSRNDFFHVHKRGPGIG